MRAATPPAREVTYTRIFAARDALARLYEDYGRALSEERAARAEVRRVHDGILDVLYDLSVLADEAS